MNALKTGVLTTEFWVALGSLAAKVTVLLFTLNLIHAGDPDKVVQQISEAIAAIGALFAISHGTANYVSNRTQLKAAALAQPVTTSTIVDQRGGKF